MKESIFKLLQDQLAKALSQMVNHIEESDNYHVDIILYPEKASWRHELEWVYKAISCMADEDFITEYTGFKNVFEAAKKEVSNSDYTKKSTILLAISERQKEFGIYKRYHDLIK